MKRYDRNKTTDTPWLGEIPAHWEVKRMRFICDYQKGKNPDSLSFDEEEGMKPYLSMEYIRANTTTTQYAYPSESTIICEEGDLLLLWDGSNAGEFLKSKSGILCSTCAKLFPHALNNAYYWYLVKACEEYLKDLTNGMGIPHVDGGVFKNLLMPVPPIAEQEGIVRYLDGKCGSIDKVIATQEQRITLLGELKQSIITEAVTHGLDPQAPLRPSGIDWLGNIPQHWEVMKVAHLFSIIGSGTTPSTDTKEYYDEDGLNWLQTGDLTDGYITETSKHISAYAVKKLNMKIYEPNSLVVAMYGATVGKVGLLSISTTVNQACCVLSNSKLLLPKFAYYSFLSAKKILISQSVGGGQPNISQDLISAHKVTVPPISEQQAIADYLDGKCARIDSAIAKAQREIELLREYRQSVITEAVTGKIKVC